MYLRRFLKNESSSKSAQNDCRNKNYDFVSNNLLKYTNILSQEKFEIAHANANDEKQKESWKIFGAKFLFANEKFGAKLVPHRKSTYSSVVGKVFDGCSFASRPKDF